MKKVFNVTGMTCEGCKAKVSYVLSNINGVSAAAVDLTTGRVEVTSDGPLATSLLIDALTPYKKYTLFESDQSPTDNIVVKKSSWLKTYKPLLIIFGFILGVSLIASVEGEILKEILLMRYFMAGFFLVFSFFKLLDVKAFAASYAQYDLLASRFSNYGLIYPFIELGLGIAYLTGFQMVWTNYITIGAMGFSSIGVIKSVMSNNKIQCACLGSVFNLPMSVITIVEDLLMIAMAIAMLVF